MPATLLCARTTLTQKRLLRIFLQNRKPFKPPFSCFSAPNARFPSFFFLRMRSKLRNPCANPMRNHLSQPLFAAAGCAARNKRGFPLPRPHTRASLYSAFEPHFKIVFVL